MRRLPFVDRMRNRHLLAVDTIIACLTPSLALLLRVETSDRAWHLALPLLEFTVLTGAVKLLIFRAVGLYKTWWPFAGEKEMSVLLIATALASAAVVALSFTLFSSWGPFPLSPPLPRSIPFIDGLLTMLMVGGVRSLVILLGKIRRHTFADISTEHPSLATDAPATERVLIAGAGMAGVMLASQLTRDDSSGMVPAGFIDDDAEKQGKTLHGLPVLGTLDDLQRVAGAYRVNTVIIAMPAVPGEVVRRIVASCKKAGIQSKTLPGLQEILRGTASIREVRSIELEDLLRRGSLKTDRGRIGVLVEGKRIMVTGAGGSIGSEICRQVMEFHPSEVLLLGHGEDSLFNIAHELRKVPAGTSVMLTPVVADVRDRSRMKNLFDRHRPEIVFHAAAHKHVRLMQENIPDAITNNIVGTETVLGLCSDFPVETMVLISSDKAVNPSSVMGVTKRVAELLVYQAVIRSGKRFVTVRFGNVLGSRGSVVPIFQRQIREGGPLTVSHPDVRRYFMTISEAVHLVLQAATMGKGGEVFVLDMGEQIRIADLASDLIRLHGLKEGEDIDIVYTGLAPGEKVSEELFYKDDKIEPTLHDKILVCRNGHMHGGARARTLLLESQLRRLEDVTRLGSETEMLTLLKAIVPEFTPPSNGHAYRPGPEFSRQVAESLAVGSPAK